VVKQGSNDRATSALCKAHRKNRLKPLYLFYLLTGCRRSEALTLKWTDIDFAAKSIYISGTKTDNAKRSIPLFPELEKLLNSIPRKNPLVFPYTDNPWLIYISAA